MTRKRWTKPRCSSRKAAYQSQGKALTAIRLVEVENAQAVAPRAVRAPLSAYRCEECGAWHLTKLSGVRVGP